ncbi:MAG: hypothetical protein AAGH42_11510 [Pseudomonadota bacterium]
MLLYFGMINWTHIWFDQNGPNSHDEIAQMAAKKFSPRCEIEFAFHIISIRGC